MKTVKIYLNLIFVLLLILNFSACVPQGGKLQADVEGDGNGGTTSGGSTSGGTSSGGTSSGGSENGLFDGQSEDPPETQHGVADFQAVRDSLEQFTGINTFSNNAIRNEWLKGKGSLATTTKMMDYSNNQATATFNLTYEFCNALVNNATQRAQIWPGLNFNSALSAMNNVAVQDQVIAPLHERCIGKDVDTAPSNIEVTTTLRGLASTLASQGGGEGLNFRDAVSGLCIAACGGGAHLVH